MYAAVLNGGGRESQGGNFREGLNHDNEDAAHIPITKLVIGSWSIVAKYDEHVLLSFYWAERKVVWEVLQLGVVRKMEVDFDDVTGAMLSPVSGSDAERLVLELARPPRFYRETQASTDDSAAVNYVYTTDFTNGQASQVQRHSLLFASGAASKHAGTMKAAGLPLRVEGGAMALGSPPQSARLDGALRSPVGALALAARLRKPPTSSPRLDAIILQEQLEREMRECQARYAGICPVRDRIYTAAFDELIVAIGRDEQKRGMMLRRVRDEAKLSCDNYRTVFDKSVNFGCLKLSQAVALMGDLEAQTSNLEDEIKQLSSEAKRLTNSCESLAHRAEQRAKSYELKNKEVVDLTTETQQLEDLLSVLRLSKPAQK